MTAGTGVLATSARVTGSGDSLFPVSTASGVALAVVRGAGNAHAAVPLIVGNGRLACRPAGVHAIVDSRPPAAIGTYAGAISSARITGTGFAGPLGASTGSGSAQGTCAAGGVANAHVPPALSNGAGSAAGTLVGGVGQATPPVSMATGQVVSLITGLGSATSIYRSTAQGRAASAAAVDGLTLAALPITRASAQAQASAQVRGATTIAPPPSTGSGMTVALVRATGHATTTGDLSAPIHPYDTTALDEDTRTAMLDEDTRSAVLDEDTRSAVLECDDRHARMEEDMANWRKPKDPADRAWYTLDTQPIIGSTTITNATATSATLDIQEVEWSGTTVRLYIAGGAVGVHRVNVVLDTADDQHFERPVTLTVADF